MKKALIIGCEGQDGFYLKKNLESRGYEIIGVGKNVAFSSTKGGMPVIDILKEDQVINLLSNFQPDEIYFLAAFHQSSEDVKCDDFFVFKKSIDVNIKALIFFLEGIRAKSKHSKLFYAASSHIFGNPDKEEQDENTPVKPNCIYGITKAAGLNICRFYRNNHSVNASVGILYNHESPLRKSIFVSKKIVEGAIAISNKSENKLVVGDLSATIDWGYAPDYVEAMHSILQLSEADEFIISSGVLHTVKDFVSGVFNYLNLDWKKYVIEDPSILTKKNKKSLKGNSTKLQVATGWKPKNSFDELIKIMVDDCIRQSG